MSEKTIWDEVNQQILQFKKQKNKSIRSLRNELIKKYGKKFKNIIINNILFNNICGYCGNEFLKDNSKLEFMRNNDNNNKNFRKIRKIKHVCDKCLKKCCVPDHLHNQANYIKISDTLLKYRETDIAKEEYRKIGEYNSLNLKRHFATDKGIEQIKRVAQIQSKIMVEKIKNGEFTPNVTNTWTHWKAFISINGNIYKYRSSWEACFALCHFNYKYEQVRIPYLDKNNIKHVYVTDFYDEKNNTIYEIKPVSFYLKQKNKMDQAIAYCLKNKIKFIWINEYNILDYIDKDKFNNHNIKQYYMLLKGIKNVKRTEN